MTDSGLMTADALSSEIVDACSAIMERRADGMLLDDAVTALIMASASLIAAAGVDPAHSRHLLIVAADSLRHMADDVERFAAEASQALRDGGAH